ncbi:MAG: hypothetical protein LBS32_03150, partial [Clostridiales Family XIII bacterium]|nr:hypothetical protein [Clostridiales Family XIII bacterium]
MDGAKFHYVVGELMPYAAFAPHILLEYEDIISKLYILDLDPMKSVVAPLYSNTGRPSNHQPEIFRTFVIMSGLGIRIDDWREKLKNNQILRSHQPPLQAVVCRQPLRGILPAPPKGGFRKPTPLPVAPKG